MVSARFRHWGHIRFTPDCHPCPLLAASHYNIPVSIPCITTGLNRRPPVSQGAGGDGVRVRGRDGVRRGCGVAEVALGEAERMAGGESGVGGRRAMAEGSR